MGRSEITRSVATGWRAVRGGISLGLLWLCSLWGAGCGYNVGAPFSQEVRTVAVSIPKSDSPRRFLEMQLTEAVQKQIQQRTHFRLAREGEADTALVLRLTDLQKGMLGQTENSDARELQISLRVAAEWVDRRSGDVLREQSFDLGKMPKALMAQAEYAPEVGQSLATAEREVIDRMARDIVNMMETPW
ncbi:MAG: LPS assembly lipoprotein LptE [Planctomycetaceae bacterium]